MSDVLRSAMRREGWAPAPSGDLGDWQRRLQAPFSLRAELSEDDGDVVTWSVMVVCPEAHALLDALDADDAAAFVALAPPAVAPARTAQDIDDLVAAVGRAAAEIAEAGSSIEAFVAAVRADPELVEEARFIVAAVYAVGGRAEEACASVANAPPSFRAALERWMTDGTLPARSDIAPETEIVVPWRQVSPAAVWRVWRAGRRSY